MGPHLSLLNYWFLMTSGRVVTNFYSVIPMDVHQNPKATHDYTDSPGTSQWATRQKTECRIGKGRKEEG